MNQYIRCCYMLYPLMMGIRYNDKLHHLWEIKLYTSEEYDSYFSPRVYFCPFFFRFVT